MISGSCCAIVALVALLCLSQLRIFAQRRELAAARELASLASARDHRIKARLKRMHRLLRAAEVRENVSVCPPPSSVATKPASGDSATGTGTGSGTAEDGLPASLLLKAQRSWDWRAIASEALRPWGSIRKEQLDTAVAACNDNGTMYCQRLQVHKGSLYLTDYRAIFFDRHYAPARVWPLLAALRRHRDLPDVDIVVAGNDEPRVPAFPGVGSSWAKTCRRWPGEKGGPLPPAIFASTTSRGVMDLPWLDFAWYFPRKPHKLRTPPWSVLHPQLVEAGGKVRWEDKLEIAMHTGNVGSVHRKSLAAVAEKAPREVFVNELFIGDHGKIRQTCKEMGLHATGGYQQHKCFMRFEDQCSYKYLLNSASIGYANKFKSLLLCGSVVLYVREGMRHKEFYEYGLLPGVHYHAVDTAAEVPAAVKWLREHDEYARAVAAAGRARMSALDEPALTDFVAELLTQYSTRQSFKVAPLPGAVRIDCEDDLWRHYALSQGWARLYLKEDNDTCIHPIPAGATLGPPGWGGAYNGSKPRCLAGHDLNPRAQPDACKFEKPFSTSESFAPPGEFPVTHPRDREGWNTRWKKPDGSCCVGHVPPL